MIAISSVQKVNNFTLLLDDNQNNLYYISTLYPWSLVYNQEFSYIENKPMTDCVTIAIFVNSQLWLQLLILPIRVSSGYQNRKQMVMWISYQRYQSWVATISTIYIVLIQIQMYVVLLQWAQSFSWRTNSNLTSTEKQKLPCPTRYSNTEGSQRMPAEICLC